MAGEIKERFYVDEKGCFNSAWVGASPPQDLSLVEVPVPPPTSSGNWIYKLGAWHEVLPVPTVEDVKAECLRRRKLMVGLPASAAITDLDYKIISANSEAVFYIDKQQRGEALTQEEATRADHLRTLQKQLADVVVRSNAIQAELANKPDLDVCLDAVWNTSKTLPEALAELT